MISPHPTPQPTLVQFDSRHGRSLTTHERLLAVVDARFGPHPFTAGLDRSRLERLLPDFLGLSLSFRYLQAAAQKEVIWAAIRENREVPPEIEMMNAVGNYLTWDETGGVDLLAQQGKQGLPELLDSRRLHSSMLRADASKILGRPVAVSYSPDTRRYLFALYEGLAALDVVVRCATMVAFEIHANAVLQALWAAVVESTGLDADVLPYFARHVGGDDPAEQYHMDMTQRLIERVVPDSETSRFLHEFERAYELHIDWCRGFTAAAHDGATAARGAVRVG